MSHFSKNLFFCQKYFFHYWLWELKYFSLTWSMQWWLERKLGNINFDYDVWECMPLKIPLKIVAPEDLVVLQLYITNKILEKRVLDSIMPNFLKKKDYNELYRTWQNLYILFLRKFYVCHYILLIWCCLGNQIVRFS